MRTVRTRPFSSLALLAGAGLIAAALIPAGAAPATATEATASAAPAVAGTAAFAVRDTSYPGVYTGSDGKRWSATGGFDSGAKVSTRPAAAVAGTSDADLFRYATFGMRSWSVPVPADGEYRVRLLMSEQYWTSPGQRVFDVRAEGVLAADDVDIAAAAGPKTAHVVEFTVPVTDGRLNLGFTAVKDKTLVSSIEVTPASGGEDPALRWSARQAARLGPSGDLWRPMTAAAALTGASSSVRPASTQVAGTGDPELYRSQAFGNMTWRMPVANGSYRVRLDATDLWATRAGQRVFDVRAEGAIALDDVDIVAQAGPATAWSRSFDVSVSDGTLDLGFKASANHAILAGITLTPSGAGEPAPSPSPTGSGSSTPAPSAPSADPSSAPSPDPVPSPSSRPEPQAEPEFTARMVAAPAPVTDSGGKVWSRWSGTLGSVSLSQSLVGTDIAGTDEDELYARNVWNVRGYSLNVPGTGSYRVRLMFAESTFATAGKRVFDVRAENALAVADVDVARAAGIRTAHDVVFQVHVGDGVLDLEFVRKADNPFVAAIEVTSVGAITRADALTATIPVWAHSVYRQDISSAPVAPNGSQVGDYIAAKVAERYGGMAGFNAYDYAVGIAFAQPGTPRIDVEHSCAVSWGVPPNLYDGHGHFVSVPVPQDARPASGGDGQLTIYDPQTDQLWEFWQMRRNDSGGWSACWGGRIDGFSSGEAVFPAGFGASASGMAVAPGAVTLQDVRRGRIDHALTLAVPEPAAGSYSWPANRTDGTSGHEHAPLEGQRLRLRPGLNLDEYNLTPVGRMIAEAAQRYGFIVTDNSGAVAVSAESGNALKAATGVNPWDRYLGGAAWETMRNFPWGELEALPVDHGRP